MSEQLAKIGKSGISGYADPEGEAPWVMELVVRIEKVDPPQRTQVCEAVGMAVARLLADERAAVGGEWSPLVERWLDGRIRKHCRRARGAAWDKASSLPGVTVCHGGAQVRSFVPCATDQIPCEIAKLQLSGAELDDDDVAARVDPISGGPLVVAICPAPHLPLGKAASAAGHAAQVAALRMPAERLAVWAGLGFAVRVEHPQPERWLWVCEQAPVRIVDAGLTIVEPGTTTAVARWQ